MKYLLLLFLLISGCVTVSQKQSECEAQYTAFADVVSCTKKSFENNPKAQKDANFKLYILKGDQLSEQVRLGEISELDAKVEWQKLFVELRGNQRSESAAAAARYNATKPKQTTCTPVGNTVTCQTY